MKHWKTDNSKYYTKNMEPVILVFLGSIKLTPKTGIFFWTELEFAFVNKDAFVY